MEISSFSLALFLGCLIALSYSLDSVSADFEGRFRPDWVPKYLVFIKYPKGVNHEKFDIKVLAEAVGSIDSAKVALLYHFNAWTGMSEPGFMARLTYREFKIIKKNPHVTFVTDFFMWEPQVYSDDGLHASLFSLTNNPVTRFYNRFAKNLADFLTKIGYFGVYEPPPRPRV